MTSHSPFLRSALRHSMGIKALDPADWIDFGDDAPHQLAERRRLIDERPDEVIAGLPGSEAAQAELLALLLDHLAQHAADRYNIEASTITEQKTGLSYSRNQAPLALAGWLVQEDFCLMQKRDGAYGLTAAILCFPAHWTLADKIGKPLNDIHAPVPAFAEQLGNPVARLFDTLTPEKPVQRLNWSLVDTDRLFLPPSHRSEHPMPDIADIHLRVERQTFRRLAETGAVVFGIRTHVVPLAEAIDSADAANALLQRLDELPAAMLAYKNLVAKKPALSAFLEERRAAML